MRRGPRRCPAGAMNSGPLRRSASACGRGGGACTRRHVVVQPCHLSAGKCRRCSRRDGAPARRGAARADTSSGHAAVPAAVPARSWPRMQRIWRSVGFRLRMLGSSSAGSRCVGLADVELRDGCVLWAPAADAFASSACAAGRRPSRATTAPVPSAAATTALAITARAAALTFFTVPRAPLKQ